MIYVDGLLCRTVSPLFETLDRKRVISMRTLAGRVVYTVPWVDDLFLNWERLVLASNKQLSTP